MPWKRPNIGSRMNREVHVRIWQRPEVRVLRATRQPRRFPMSAPSPVSGQSRKLAAITDIPCPPPPARRRLATVTLTHANGRLRKPPRTRPPPPPPPPAPPPPR